MSRLVHFYQVAVHCEEALQLLCMRQLKPPMGSFSNTMIYVLQAVQATMNVDKGNVQLKKAIRVGGSARSYLFWFFVIAAASLLFLDWFYS